MVGTMIAPVEAPIETRRNLHGAADVLVVGAGVFGLWAARHAIRAGRKVLVLEKRRAGAGASGGFLGALMPHMPDRWNAKKQIQFAALTGLETAIAALEADTGMRCGYKRCGRLMPLLHERTRAIAGQRMRGAQANWPGFSMQLLEPPFSGTPADGWLSPQMAPFGAQWDDLSARLDPRALVAALAAFVRNSGELREGMEVVALKPGQVVLADGSAISAGQIIIANGWEAYRLLQPFMGQLAHGGIIGRGVKGQALLLDFPHADDRPLVYHDGAYVVPQTNGRIAIGSSTVEDWQGAPDRFDDGDTGFHGRVLTLVPALGDALVMEKWAGVRPRNMFAGKSSEAFFGPVPGLPGVSARIGGFKTGMAMGWLKNQYIQDIY